LSQNGYCLDQKARVWPTGIPWNFGMKLYQSNLEGESRPNQWVTFQNAHVGTRKA
jgi:hypothetical protein